MMLCRKVAICLPCFLCLAVATELSAGHKRSAAVPPGLEMEVLDPGVDPVGNPAVLTAPSVDGQLRIDIPPTVIVHRYYYTGDRKFQGPMLPGGPAIVVVNNHKTGERMYLEMQMLPGAPRVCYTSRTIEYDYGKQGITICFDGCFCKPCCNPKVTYRNHKPVLRVVGGAVAGVAKATHHVTVATGASDLACHVKNETKNLAGAAACAVKTAGKIVLTPVIVVVEALPGAKALQSSAEQRAADARDASVQRAGTAAAQSNASIPTVR